MNWWTWWLICSRPCFSGLLISKYFCASESKHFHNSNICFLNNCISINQKCFLLIYQLLLQLNEKYVSNNVNQQQNLFLQKWCLLNCLFEPWSQVEFCHISSIYLKYPWIAERTLGTYYWEPVENYKVFSSTWSLKYVKGLKVIK